MRLFCFAVLVALTGPVANAQSSGGFIGFGPTLQAWSLEDIDPGMSGTPVGSTFRIAIFMDDFFLGYHGTRTRFYGTSANVGDASGRTRGLMGGYRFRPARTLRAGAQLTVGRGHLRVEETGGHIVANENYFSVIPEAMFGVAPLRWLLIEARAGYNGAFGSDRVEATQRPYAGFGLVFGTN
jgi:hypothetical protein